MTTQFSRTFPFLRTFLLISLCSTAWAAPLIPTGAVWRYLDNGSDQGTAWLSPAFSDTGWPSGSAQLGYGDGDETTVVSYGPDAARKFITTYFRHGFNVADASVYQSANLRLLRDDGAVVYLNGTEVFRSNMPSGTVGYRTLASAAIDDSTYYVTTINPALLATGWNVVAVEVHQANETSSDISFDIELNASAAATLPLVVRGPYLQKGSPQSITVRWRTDVATDSQVCYGTVQGVLTQCVNLPGSRTEHEVTLNGLSADSRYYYSVGNAAGALAGNDSSYFFVTHPPVGVAKPTRVWVLGDSGTADGNVRAVRDAFANFTGSRHTDLWMMLGDNAYDTGTDAQFQAAVFNMFPEMLRKSVLWSTRGNHEATDGSGSVYYNIHTFPRQGESGGVASGTEAYYSFDYGNIHFVCLDAFGSSRSASGAMANWLRQDLLATLQEWTIAFWHHPPYTKGSHNSDTEVELIEMRQNFLPILDDAGVDLVLCGHSHSYERSYLIDGHYGTSSTFNTSHIKQPGNGREDGAGAYLKSPGSVGHEGAVYVVAGSSGKTSGGSLNHPAMVVSLNNLGSLVLDVDGSRLDARFVRENGAVADYFTLIKPDITTPPGAPAGLSATATNAAVRLAWAATATATSYNLKRATADAGPYSIVGVTTATNFVDSGLINGTTYFYRVSAVNNAGEGADSATVSATPQAPPAVLPPSNLTAAPGKGKITLRWQKSISPGVTAYRIYGTPNSGGPYSLIAQAGPGTSYTDQLGRRITRYYVVTAVGGSGAESGYSNEAGATAK